jgi:hypothetical protein
MKEERNSRVFGIVFFLIVVCLVSFPAQAQYGGGSGRPDDPYLIYTAEQMNAIGINSFDLDSHFKLMADIDLSAYQGTSFNIIGGTYGYFKGVFDGNGHTISNFSYFSADIDNVGIFGRISGGNALVKDLGLIDPSVDVRTSGMSYRGRYIGTLAGNLQIGTISNCYVSGGSVSGNEYVGGLVGANSWNGTITGCSSSVDVSGFGTDSWSGGVGGLVGDNNGTISNCSSTGIVSGNNNVGGLVGNNNYSGTILCSDAGNRVTGAGYVGGLAGKNDNKVAYCYATGTVTGITKVGGLTGENGYSGTITYCYATTSVTGTTGAGGLVGTDEYTYGEVISSFWDIETSGQLSSGGGTGMTTTEMQNANILMDAGWDFVDKEDGPSDIWAVPAGGGYPILWWQLAEPPKLPTFLGGTGKPNDPYIVSTASDLNSIGNNPRLMGAHFNLTSDIDLAGIDYYIIGSEEFPFTGVFEGNGYTISNFSYISMFYRTKGIGLFGCVDGSDAKIRNLLLIGPNINGRYEVGTLVGQFRYGIISGCHAEGGVVSGRNNVGGLVGIHTFGTIINSSATDGNVLGTGSGAGGLVGRNSGTITDCYTTGNILGNMYIGGLVGAFDNGTISHCYSAGSVLGDDNVGGLVGRNMYGIIADCYSTNSVIGIEHTGGLVGSGGCAHNSFWDVQTSGQTTSAGGKGRTTIQMQTASTFLGWDKCGNAGVWTIDDGNDYPRLWWEDKPGEALETQELSALLTGTGTGSDPYLIYTAEELNLIGLFPCELNKYFKLMEDIDLSHFKGTEFNIIGILDPLSGVFEGNGKKISNLRHIRGLFVTVSGTIRNLGLIDTIVDAGVVSNVGSLVGNLESGIVTNCYSEGGSVSGNGYIGGLIGILRRSEITNCHATCSVTGTGWRVGGLVGEISWDSAITNCYATGNVIGNGWYVGGLVGELSSGVITNCYSSGEVSGEDNVGGLLGESSWGSTIAKCYSSSDVSGEDNVGGLVGSNGEEIMNCYATGSVFASGTGYWAGVGGGLVGENSWGGTITKCYSTGSVIALGTEWQAGVSGGLVGEGWGQVMDSFWDTQTSGLATSGGGTGKTTVEMQTESTFTDAGWDFVAENVNGMEDIWKINEGVDYPRLTWQTDGGGIDVPEPTPPPEPPVPQPPTPPPPPKGRGCFLADTPVWVNGTLVQISNVTSGQMIGRIYCDPSDCLEKIEIVEEHEGTFECRDIVLESGRQISVVDAHCFMLDSGQWIAAQNLRSGLRLKTFNGTVGIKSVVARETPFIGKVYNLKIKGTDQYFAGEDRIIVRDF